MTDATGGPQHEHALSGLNIGCLDERLPGREPGERQRGGLHVREPLGCPGELARRRGHVLGVGACFLGKARHSEDPVSRREPRDAPAECLDRPGDVPADRERRLTEEAAPRANLPVDRVDPGCVDADEHLGRRRFGPLHLDELEHLRPTDRLAA